MATRRRELVSTAGRNSLDRSTGPIRTNDKAHPGDLALDLKSTVGAGEFASSIQNGRGSGGSPQGSGLHVRGVIDCG